MPLTVRGHAASVCYPPALMHASAEHRVPGRAGPGSLAAPPGSVASPLARSWLWLAVALASALAWSNRFLLDDAYIAFRYAANLAHGHGLVWNPGERVEGYTNFLWTLLLAGGIALHVDPAASSMALGMACFVGSLLATFELALRLTGSVQAAYLALLLLGTHYTFTAFATSGLETQMQCFLLVLTALAALPPRAAAVASEARLLGFSLLVAAALLTRLDSLLVAGPIALAVLVRTLTEPRRDRAAALVLLLAPCALTVGTWLAWKRAYYGSFLPNTLLAKLPVAHAPVRAMRYLRAYVNSYLLAPLALAVVIGAPRLARAGGLQLGGLALLILFWAGYLLRIGGDFMEFRLLAPILPFAFVLASWALDSVVTVWPLRAGLVAITLVGSWLHATRYDRHPSGWIESVTRLAGHLERPAENWSGIGHALGRAFGEGSSVSVATTAAGAIPYYSGLPAVDMLGLTDPWVVRHGVPLGDQPGHVRIAPLRYLIARRVNLLIAHPIVLAPGEAVTRLPHLGEPVGAQLVGRRVLQIPIGSGYRVLAIYLTPHPAVDAAIAREGWAASDITPELAATVQ